jgi:hypothetical protein
MFKVDNADFIADKLAAELLPNQEFREVLKNSLEAVTRRMAADGTKTGGYVQFDVDWHLLGELYKREKTYRWFVACSDNGDGMSRTDIDRYTTTLAVQGAGRSRSIRGNQGMGLKISGPTRHKAGVLIRSLRSNERTAVQIGWDGFEYGKIPIGPNDETVTRFPSSAFPAIVEQQRSGTVVTFLGNPDKADKDNTFVPPERPNGWLFKYLNTRFFRLSKDGIIVQVRVPSGGIAEWPHTFAEAADRMRKKGGRSFNLQNVYGTGTVWDEAAAKEGGASDIVSLAGLPAANIPQADLHWWVLPTEGSDVSSRTNSGGSFAVLYDNELHDWRTSNQASPYFARLGVLFGKSRIAFVLEPKGPTVASDFARAHVLISGTPVLESEAWLVWARQFQELMPDKIKQTMREEQNLLQAEDPDRLKRIHDRLREVMQLLRPRRFRPSISGETMAGGPTIAGPGNDAGEMLQFPSGNRIRNSRRGVRGIGAVLSDVDDPNGTAVNELETKETLESHWVTEEQSANYSLVRGNGNGLHDRAAALAGIDGRTAAILLLNREFRGYSAILAAINEWANPEGDEDKSAKIESITQEWIEQKMVEAVQGLRQLENGKTWILEHYDEALSPVSLTAVFMADRFHTLREVKRAVGMFRSQSAAS